MGTRPILVGYDGSEEARAALGWALDEAACTDRPVQLLFALEWVNVGGWIGPGVGPDPWPDEANRREIEAMLRSTAADATASHPGVSVRGEVFDGSAAVLLQERSARAALVVLGSRGHGGFAGLVAGSTAVAVTSHAHCPVVVVRVPAVPGRPVVVGVDGSEYSLLALGFAFDRAERRGVALRVIRAWTPPATPWRSPEVDLERINGTERTTMRELLAGWSDRYPGVNVTVDVLAGSPAAALVEATRTAQLAVVGSRGRGGFRGLLLGSVSQQLLQHGECPVAVVRELPAGQE
jgi:nucleotide-binding universal stress UspA family protein